MKVGDVLICKKRVEIGQNWSSWDRHVILVHPNQKVTVASLHSSFLVTLIYNKYNDSFVMSSIGKINFYDYIWDYFYTEKELRKMKLEKLINVATGG